MVVSGWCVWITGLPGSGKSTIAHLLSKELRSLGIHVCVLSSDALRKVMTPNPRYTEEERDVVYGTLVYIAKLLTDNGVNVIIDATGNRRKYRDNARREISQFMEEREVKTVKVEEIMERAVKVRDKLLEQVRAHEK
jgi:adenylylsulfate kinase